MSISQQPLNASQLEVLHWIGEDCPDGRWTGYSYKTTALALSSRRLIAISKKGGIWRAELLPSGRFYLDNNAYPEGHWTAGRRTMRPTEPAVAAVAPRKPAQRRPLVSLVKRSPPSANEIQTRGLSPTRQLLKDVADAGGMLERDVTDDPARYSHLVGVINGRRMLPDNQQLLMVQGKTSHHLRFRLSTASDWQTKQPIDVVAADRIGRWHPVVAELRSDDCLAHIGGEARQRAYRLLQAIAVEADARGYGVRRSGPQQAGDELVVAVGEIQSAIRLVQLHDRVPHVPNKYELALARRTHHMIPEYDDVLSDRLRLFLNKTSWSDGDKQALTLEGILPDVLTTMERWSHAHAERTEAKRVADIEAAERREKEDVIAAQAYEQDAFAKRLLADAEQWERIERLRTYVAALRIRAEGLSTAEQRTAANEWIDWCDAYIQEHDPLERPIAMPSVKPADFSEMREMRARLGFRSW